MGKMYFTKQGVKTVRFVVWRFKKMVITRRYYNIICLCMCMCVFLHRLLRKKMKNFACLSIGPWRMTFAYKKWCTETWPATAGKRYSRAYWEKLSTIIISGEDVKRTIVKDRCKWRKATVCKYRPDGYALHISCWRLKWECHGTRIPSAFLKQILSKSSVGRNILAFLLPEL